MTKPTEDLAAITKSADNISQLISQVNNRFNPPKARNDFNAFNDLFGNLFDKKHGKKRANP